MERSSRSRLARWVMATAAVAAVGAAAIMPVGAQTAPAAPAARPEPPKWPDFNETVKDMTPTSGLFTLYRYKPDDPSKDQSRLLCQIPRGLMKQDLLFATSISRGPYAGFMWDDYLVRFEMIGRNVVMRVPDVRYVQTPGQPVTDAVMRTYTDTYLAAMPIVTMSPSGDPVVDLGQVLMGPTVGLPMGGGGLFGFSGMVMPRRDLSQYSKIKVFPDNALIDVDLAVSSRGSGGTTLGVSYAFRKLPDARAYTPRVADERVGYFTTARQDWNTKYHERENIVRYVNRWDLKKKDPSLELSPPEKPITFIIEKTVPLQWRKYVQDGIAEWNKAYEKLGIVNAIIVQQQEEGNDFAQIDPEDARYNFIRWIVTGNAFAMGPSRADPRTGQILDADIIFDDSLLRYYYNEFDVFGPAPAASMVGPELTKFLEENPAFITAGQTLEQVQAASRMTAGEMLYDAPKGQAGLGPKPNVSRKMRSYATCNFAAGMKHQMAFTAMALTATGKKIPEKFIGEQIKHITAHEVGHTLGLRHNFKSSSWLSLDEIRRRRDNTDDATFGSVMDYNPILYFAGDDPQKMRHFVSPCIGPYDYWAIEYGYKQPGREDGDEKTMLAKIAAQSTKRENAYATDEDVMGMTSPDPLANREDMGENPIDWARTRVELCDALMKDIKKWAIKKDEPAHYLRNTFMTIMYERARNLLFVSRLVGGQLHNRNRPGDPDAKPILVLLDPKQQRDALAVLADTIFKDEFFTMEPELLNDLAPNRHYDWASDTAVRLDLPVHQLVNTLQSYALLQICAPQVLQRVYDAELKSKAEDKFTAAELVVSVRQIIWGGLGAIPEDAKFTSAKPLFSSIKRNLQKQHLQYLLAIADARSGSLVSPDLQNTVRFATRELGEQIGEVLEKSKTGPSGSRLDYGTRAHLSECKSEIDRVLNAPHIKMPASPMIMLQYGYEGQVPQQQPQQQQPVRQGHLEAVE